MSAKTENILSNTDKRLFYLSDDIDNTSIAKLCFNLLFLLQEDDNKESKEKDFKREPINIYINSYGGSVYDMWALIDIIEKSKTPIHTYCAGYAMSAAFQIFLSGHKRFATRHATFMYHQISGYDYGKYQDLVDIRPQWDYLTEQIEEYVIERTKMTKEQLYNIREKKIDTYIHPEEALGLGIIDEIV